MHGANFLLFGGFSIFAHFQRVTKTFFSVFFVLFCFFSGFDDSITEGEKYTDTRHGIKELGLIMSFEGDATAAIVTVIGTAHEIQVLFLFY